MSNYDTKHDSDIDEPVNSGDTLGIHALHDGEERQSGDGESFDAVPQQKRQIGLVSAVFLIFNRIIGTGIFATPSSILHSSGSVGLALFMWVIGAVIATAGLAVYIEWGTGLPRSGGEKNYLEFIYRRPRFLVTCMFACYACLLGWAAGNSVVFGECKHRSFSKFISPTLSELTQCPPSPDILHAASAKVTDWNQRAVGLACITFAWLIHSCALKWGLRLQNVLGVFKIVILLVIALSGFAALAGRIKLPEDHDQHPHNFRNAFEGTNGNANAFVTGLYNVIWSFIGYSNANYAMSEMKNPIRTIKRAGPIAMVSVTIVYLLVNVAYFAAVPKTEILSSGRIIAALYFRNMFGTQAEKAISVFVALSALGNVMAVIFSQGRINQELAREGVIPFSRFFASNKPFGAPMAALGLHWLVTVIIIVAPPAGDAYNFILNLVSYPLAIINAAISGGLLFLYLPIPIAKQWDWKPPFRASIPVVAFFFLSNVFLAVAPLVPPAKGDSVYEHLPYWLHVVVAIGVFALGGVYWIFWSIVFPRWGHYRLEREVVLQDDGVSRAVFKHVHLD